MPKTSKNISLDWESPHQHENPSASMLEQKLSGRNAIKYCNVYFPAELHARLLRHANQQKISLRELVRLVIENWLSVHAGNIDKIRRGEVEIPAVEDGRKSRKNRGELQNIVAHLPREIHQRLKQITVIRKLTMRGVIVGITQEWAKKHCA